MTNYPIPTLTKEKWEDLQEILNNLTHLSIAVEKGVQEDPILFGKMNEISICLGLIDSILGRSMTISEAEERLMEKLYGKGKE